MFKALAEAWHWPPAVVETLTHDQLMSLSGGGKGDSASGPALTPFAITVDQLDYYREQYLAYHSPEAELRRAERRLARELERLARRAERRAAHATGRLRAEQAALAEQLRAHALRD